MRQRARVRRHTQIYAGKVFRVERDEVEMPNGHVVTMDVVRHRGSVVLVPQLPDGRIILIRQFRYAIGRWIWELPAGSLEPGEAPSRAARRECDEETGWAPRRIRRLGVFYPTPGFCDEKMTFYLCAELARPARPREQDLDEDIDPHPFTVRQIRALIAGGDIVDMKTVLGLVLMGQATGGSRPGAPGRRGTRSLGVRA